MQASVRLILPRSIDCLAGSQHRKQKVKHPVDALAVVRAASEFVQIALPGFVADLHMGWRANNLGSSVDTNVGADAEQTGRARRPSTLAQTC